MTAPDETLLILGIILFATLLVALVVLLARGKPITSVLVAFIAPIVMIGFSEIGSAESPWLKFTKESKYYESLNDYAHNPNDTRAIGGFNHTLDQIETIRAAHPNTPVPVEIHSNLASTVRILSLRPNLTPESCLALSRAQLFLGQTNEAVVTVNSAVKANTNLIHAIDPRLRMMLKPALNP